MASLCSAVVGFVLGAILQHKFKLIERISERINDWLASWGP